MIPDFLALQTFCLQFPQAWEDHPWNETVFKYRQKIFVFTSADLQVLSVTVKLPEDLREWWQEQPGVFIPSYVGRFGWLGIRIDSDTHWQMAQEGIAQSYQLVSRKRPSRRKSIAVGRARLSPPIRIPEL
jgi:predicted DNA-binding protein (MmcQ/YjbR family)